MAGGRKHGPRRWWLISAAVVGGLYAIAALYLINGKIVDRRLLFPRAFDAVVADAERRFIDMSVGKVEVWIGRTQPGRPADAYLMSFHGNGDSADNMLMLEQRFWREHAVEIWCMNYPGYGRSEGPAHLDRLAPAAVAVIDALRQQVGDMPIVVSGNSLGTTIALHVAARQAVQGVILRDPPPLRQLIRGEHGWWNLWLLAAPASLGIPPSLDSLAQARHVTAPGVFIFNADDLVVPLRYQQRVRDIYAGPSQSLTLPGNHNEIAPDGEGRIIEQVQWLMQQIAAD